jgi:Mg2+/Co2+ transporter CorB
MILALVPLMFIVTLILLSAFFSASETALLAASKARIHHLAVTNNKHAVIVRQLQQNIGHAISTLLLCNTLLNMSVSSLGTVFAINLFGDSGVAYVTMFIGLLVVVYAEVLPKIIAVNSAEALALSLAPALRMIIWVFSPITYTIDWFAKKHLALLFPGKMSPRRGSINAVEELKGAIDLHAQESGGARTGAQLMLRSILDLPDLEVAQVMKHRKYVHMINADEKPSQILDQILASPYTRVPLWQDDQDNVIGVIHAKDLLRAVRLHSGPIDELDIRSIASSPWFIPESTPLTQQLQAFRERHEHFALVVDEYGALLGVVTLEDILEEIVGEITDEHDITTGELRQQPDGWTLVDGSMPIRDVNRQLGWHLPDDSATTVAGLLLHESRQIPEVGQEFVLYGYTFEVMRRQRNQITLVRILPPNS